MPDRAQHPGQDEAQIILSAAKNKAKFLDKIMSTYFVRIFVSFAVICVYCELVLRFCSRIFVSRLSAALWYHLPTAIRVGYTLYASAFTPLCCIAQFLTIFLTLLFFVQMSRSTIRGSTGRHSSSHLQVRFCASFLLFHSFCVIPIPCGRKICAVLCFSPFAQALLCRSLTLPGLKRRSHKNSAPST